MIRCISNAELLLGALLSIAVLILMANSQVCLFNRASCGMAEPVFALFAAPFALAFLAAGFLHRKGRMVAGALAYLPVLAIVLLVTGQALLWW